MASASTSQNIGILQPLFVIFLLLFHVQELKKFNILLCFFLQFLSSSNDLLLLQPSRSRIGYFSKKNSGILTNS